MTYAREKLVVSKSFIDWVRTHRPEGRFSDEEWEEWIDNTFLELKDLPTHNIVKKGYW